MQNKIKRCWRDRALSATLSLALLAAPFSFAASTQAVSNEITTVNFAAEVASNANVNTSFTFTVPAGGDLATGEFIVVRVPDDLTVAYAGGTLAADVVFTSSGTIGNGSVAYDQVSRELTYTLAGADAVAAAATVTVTFNNDFLTTPAADTASGQYIFSIRTEGTDLVVDDTGAAILSVNNTLSVNAVIQEALILTIDDTTLNLTADPSVNSGEDFSQKTVLNVKTNAKSGYKIQGALAGATATASAVLDNGADQIAAGNARTTENKFGYIAYNSSVAKTQAELEADATNAQAFGNSSANLALYDGTADAVANSGVTNSQNHTVYYALNVDYLTPAGTYQGVITYTAVPTF